MRNVILERFLKSFLEMLFNTWTFVSKQFDIVTYKFYASLVLQSAFHLSKFTGQPILIINVMHEAKDMVFQQNLLEKACFIAKMSGASWSSRPVLTFGKRLQSRIPTTLPHRHFLSISIFFFFFWKSCKCPTVRPGSSFKIPMVRLKKSVKMSHSKTTPELHFPVNKLQMPYL